MRRTIDGGILLQFVVADEEQRSQRCRDLFERVRNGDEVVYLPEAALCEAVRALSDVHRWPAGRIVGFVGDLLALPGVQMQRKDLVWSALNLFKVKDVDFQAAFVAAETSAMGIEEIYSYDVDVGRIGGGVRVVAP